MKNLEKIKECLFSTDDEFYKSRLKPFFSFDFSEGPPEDEYKFFYGIYIDKGDSIQPLHYGLHQIRPASSYDKNTKLFEIKDCDQPLSPDEAGYRADFVSYLKKHQPASFKDCLFLFHLYTSHLARMLDPEGKDPAAYLPDLEKRKEPIYHALESLLEDSRGYILWRYQLENILSLFYGCNFEVIDAVRKNFGRRKNLEELSSIKFGQGDNLLQFIDSRMILLGVLPPDIRRARLLYELIAE